jgi:Big-like domain-containing protein
MRRLSPPWILLSLFVVACSSSPDQSTAPPVGKSTAPVSALNNGCTADPADITNLINTLFGGGNQNAVAVRWAQIVDLLSPPSPYDPVKADSSTFDLVGYIIDKYSNGLTLGGQSPSNAALVTSLVNQMFCFAGIDATLPGLGPDQGAGLYGPNSPATLITTGNKQGGISLPPGTGNVTTETLITIDRIPNFPGPLLTPLDQFPLYYQFNSSSGEPFNLDAVVGVCTLAPDLSRIRVAHNVPEPVPNTIEILPLAPAPFLDCSNASLSLGPSPSLRQFANWGLGHLGRVVASLVLPAPASASLATGTGTSGTTKRLSPFGTVDTLGFETGAAPTSGQSAPEGGAVTTPPAVKVKTPSGLAMKGITVTFTVSSGGGTLTPVGGGSPVTTIVGTTDDTGYVATGSWTLGTGANSVTAVATPPHPGSGIDPAAGVSFTATANPPVKLGFSVQPVDHTAGDAFGVTVLVQDVNGATVPASSAPVTLTLNGGPAGTLQGTTTVNAVQGVATFSNLVITRAGTGYTLTAGSAPLTSATSSPFNITAASPQTIAINAGDAQTKVEGTILGVTVGTIAPSVIIKDAYGNPVSGVGVTFAVASGGGSATGTSQVTNASGIATVGGWTIVAGANTLTASAPSMGPLAFVQFTATGTSSTTVLVNCAPALGNGDDLSHAFYINKLGKTLKQVTLYLAANGPASNPTPFTIQLLASAESFGAVPFGSSTQTVFLKGNASQNLASQFIFPNSAIPNGTKNVAFQFKVLSNPNGSRLYFALSSGTCSQVTETAGVLPLPLSTSLKRSVGVKVLGN